MAGLDEILGGGGQPGKKGGQRRTMLIVGAGAVLVLVFFLSRRNPAQQTAAATDTSQPVNPATVADNGAQAAQLGTDTTSALGDVATALQGQQQSFQSLADSLSQPAQAPSASPATAPITINVAPGPLGQVNAPAAAKPTSGTKVNRNPGSPRQGETYKTVPAKGGVFHVYASGKKVFVKK